MPDLLLDRLAKALEGAGIPAKCEGEPGYRVCINAPERFGSLMFFGEMGDYENAPFIVWAMTGIEARSPGAGVTFSKRYGAWYCEVVNGDCLNVSTNGCWTRATCLAEALIKVLGEK